MVLEELKFEKQAGRRLLIKQRLVKAFERLVQWLQVEGYCYHCHTWFELVEDRVVGTGWHGVVGRRVWRCPRCRVSFSRPYVLPYPYDP